VFAVCFAGQAKSSNAADAKPGTEKLDGNNKCYVCHPSLRAEELTTAHLDIAITCDECHGPSIEHMQDEMLMTEPDLLFGRTEVNKMCSNPTCHAPGGNRDVYALQDHKDRAKAEAFYKQWLNRTRPNGRAVTPDSVCTDCHGTHNLDKATKTQPEDAESADWVQLFNGQDLTGWQKSGSASWTVDNGRIIATPGADGQDGDLLTKAEYQDYLLAVTFRTDQPIHAGIWLHNRESQPGPRIEILDSQELTGFTGSVFMPGKGRVLANLRDDLLDHEGYNTISVRVERDRPLTAEDAEAAEQESRLKISAFSAPSAVRIRIQVWLNGEEIGAVRTPGPAKGRIGLHIEKHLSSEPGHLAVREVLIRRLGEPEKNTAEPAVSSSVGRTYRHSECG
jgi:hypothetical protein